MLNALAYKQLDPHTLFQWMNERNDFYLIDTLGRDHFRRAHLPRALNACVFEVSFVDQIKVLVAEKDLVIVLYGSSARSMDASKAVEKLDREGYHHLYILDGGMEAWRDSGKPVESLPDMPPPEVAVEDVAPKAV